MSSKYNKIGIFFGALLSNILMIIIDIAIGMLFQLQFYLHIIIKNYFIKIIIFF